MSGKLLLFIHAALGTLCIFAAQKAEEAAKDSPSLAAAAPWLLYLGIVGILLILDWCADYFQKSSQRRFKAVGLIDESWVERSRTGPKAAFDMGAFIEIRHSADTGFTIEGEIFDNAGKQTGHFDGSGTPNPDGRTLNYYYTGNHGGTADMGSGDFAFSDMQKRRASQFRGSFHGASTQMVRSVEGQRTGKLSKSLPIRQRLDEKRKRTVQYLSGGAVV